MNSTKLRPVSWFMQYRNQFSIFFPRIRNFPESVLMYISTILDINVLLRIIVRRMYQLKNFFLKLYAENVKKVNFLNTNFLLLDN